MKHRCKDVKLEWFCVWIGLVALFSCESNQLGTDYVGKLRLSLIADTTSLSKGVNGVTKAVNAGEFDAFLTTSDYRISILQEADTMHVYERFDEMPAEVELKEGAYTLIAEKGNNLPAAFENPYFAGSVDFSIRADMSTPIDVTCTLANARITVEYTDDFKEAYSDYTVLLSSVFTTSDLEIAKGETRPAYLQVAKEGSELGVAIRLKKVNEEEEKTYHVPTPLSIERRQNIRLIFKTDGAALEGIGLEVFLDDELIEHPVLDEGIPDFMWKPFEKPTLSPDDFTDGDKITVNVGKYENNPTVGFAMPAGISSLCIKQWREDKEEDVVTYDLATDEGVVAALERNFSWTVNGKQNGNVAGERKTGQLFLKEAINSLEAPSEEDKTYTYYWEFSGKDATGKQQETNTLQLAIVVQPAGAPLVVFNGFPETTIVEGDAMSADVEARYEAEGTIDGDKTTLTIHDGTESKSYRILTEGTTLQSDWGIIVKSENATTATVTFPKEFSTHLEAPKEGAKTYTFMLHLEDKKGKHFEMEKTLTVQAPVFELTPSANDGDAFARRAILRAKVSNGTHPEHLMFQWRKVGENAWINQKGAYQTEEICDTLKNLTAGGEQYEVRAIYREKENRVTEPIIITTEDVVDLEDGSFEDWHSEVVYSASLGSGGSLPGGIDIYQWWPYVEGSSSWWSTRNALTTSQRSGTSYYYRAYSGTVPTDNGYSGKAAEISSLGFGAGSTYFQGSGGWTAEKRAAGMLFIGSHSATEEGESEAFDYGHEFAVRPTGFKFFYKFKALNSESFRAYMVVENREQGVVTELGRGELLSNQEQTSFVEAQVNVKYSNTSLKATHMYIVFVSSTAETPSLEVITGSASDFSGNNDSRFVGNVLTIDEVQLIYE